MIALTHFAEPYAPQGNIDARAAAKAIGRPRLDPWDVFLRETLQNSWDARSQDSGGVTYCVDGYWPTEDQVELLRASVFNKVLKGSPLQEFLKAPLDEQPVLVVSDFGTKGLGGPTRADLVADEARDFVDFVRNVGRAADKALGGGTYGFGKGILWRMSGCSTILIYTKSTFRGRPVSRFIAMGHTDSYARGKQLYTGRHWWGRPDDETLIEPLEGREADELASALGMNRLEGRESGTALMVLEPLASDNTTTMDEILGRIANAALWWAWPHMVDESTRFEFTSMGQPITTPIPDTHPVLRHFADAYRQTSTVDELAGEWPWKNKVLWMQTPRKRLGALAWRRIPREDLDADVEKHVPISSHVALMRRPRFIVQYRAVREDPQGQGTVGVFAADGELNDVFAKAEPVAHDDWSPSIMGLERGTRNPVRRALELLKEEFVAAAIQVPLESTETQHQHGLVRLATRMGDLVVGSGDAAVISRPPPGPRRPNSLTAKVVGRPTLRLEDGRAVAEFQVEARIPSATTLPVRVTALPYVLTEAGADASTELDPPSVVGWSFSEDEVRAARHGVLVAIAGVHQLSVRVTVPADTAVGLTVNAHEEGEAS